MAEVEKELWIHLIQLLLEQGYAEQGAQDHGQVSFEDLPAVPRIFPT